MRCSHCEHDNTPGSLFCSQCGAKLPAGCPQCGAEVRPGDRFCSRCGASVVTSTSPAAAPEPLTLEEQFASFQEGLPTSFREQLLAHPEGENRVVTVLFADMSSSVAATGDLHPEDAVALVNRLLRAMVDVLMKYEGRVDRFLGDGLLAVFGTPVAHESDPERAILAAMEIREAARELGLEATAGINTGEVYVGGIGSERHQEVTVMGPVVNLASRLQGQAQPGQILVGAATYRQTRRAFEFTPLSLQIKGIPQPVAAYVAERPLLRPEKTRGIEGLRAELIGRDEEFAKLQDALAGLLQGQGQMVTLIGEAGVGKSRLVAELKAAIGVQAFRCSGVQEALPEHLNTRTPEYPPLWLEGRCLELSLTASYWPFLDLLREYFAWGSEEDEAARAGRLVAALRELVSRGDLSETRFDEIGPLLGHLFSVRFGNDWDERLKNAGPEEIKHRTFMAIRDLFLALSRQQPLILVLEDLHWADSLTLDLISLLMETVTFAPLFLLCVYRPEREHKCWRLGTIAAQKCAERYTEISLRELSAGQSRRLIESLLSIDNLPSAVKETILQKSGGNPFFVEEVVRSLIASGMVYQEGDAWKAREGIEKVTVPESIQSVILSRVDRLEQNLKRVLQSAAVIGRLFRRRLLEYTVQEATALERDLWELEEQALIYQERAVPEEEYSFKHVLTQETIYQNILRPRRAVFHQQVAEALETLYQNGLEAHYEQLAYHYERSGADEKAIDYLLRAGEKARRGYMNDEAIGYFQRVLERLDRTGLAAIQPHYRLAALKGLGRTYHGIGKESEAGECFQQALEVGRAMGLPVRDLVRLSYWLGDVMYWQGQHGAMIQVAEEGLRLLGDREAETEEAALMTHLAAVGYNCKGNHAKQRELQLRNARFLQRLPYSEDLRSSYITLAMMYASVDRNIEEAMEWLRALKRKAEQHHDPRALADVHHFVGLILASQGDFQGDIAQQQQAVALFNRIGDAKHRDRCLPCLMSSLLALGELHKAEELADRLHELTAQAGFVWMIAGGYMNSGTISLCQGSWEEAAGAFQKAAQLGQEIGWSGAGPMLSLGRVRLAQDRQQEALKQFTAAIARGGTDSGLLTAGLSGLEEAYGDPEEFQASCGRLRQEHPELNASPLGQWFLEAADPVTSARSLTHDELAEALAPDWVWHDPFGDCSCSVQSGLEIHAANGRDLWRINLSAPRVLRPVSGDFAVQTVCVPASEDNPVIGGLLLWRDQQNYLRLDRGTRGKHEISFQGCLENKDMIIGRGRLPAERIFLRLERQGERVRALCSADGQEWFTVGETEFPVEDPVEVGLHAIGQIDRTIYPGAYPEGTAIRFESFHVWVAG